MMVGEPENIRCEQPFEHPIDALLRCNREQFTGRVDLYNSLQRSQFFFFSGYLVWASDDRNEARRFLRLWKQFCPDASPFGVKLRRSDPTNHFSYRLLIALCKRHTVTSARISAFITEVLREAVFDVFQQAEWFLLDWEEDSTDAIERQFLLKSALQLPQHIVQSAREQWQRWKTVGLSAYSPNLVPVPGASSALLPSPAEPLSPASVLQASVSPSLVLQMIDGRSTIRELAAQSGQDLIHMGQALMPLIQSNGVQLINSSEFSDLQPSEWMF